jgi:Mrp family chromosome partitioning ATPase
LGLENVSGLEVVDGKLKPVETEGLKVVSIGFMLPSKDSPVIWRGPIKHGFIKQVLEDVNWGELDYLLIDCPPGTGDEIISIFQLAKPDAAVIVTTPQSVALEDVRKAVNFAKKAIQKIYLIENMSGLICPHCGNKIDVFGSGGGKKLAEEMGIKFLGSVPLDPEIMKSCEDGKPFVKLDMRSAEIFKSIVDILFLYVLHV